MKKFSTKAIINSSAADVWKVLVSAESYPKFDPLCIKIEGEIKHGGKIKVWSKLQPKRGFSLNVRVVDEGRKMLWQGGLPLNLFKGVRTFEVIAKDDHTSEFHMNEEFSGVLASLFQRMVPDLSDAFTRFSEGLKQFVESRP